MSNANSHQVAGDHYKSGYQHWDFVHDLDLGYFEGQITKYITRHANKNGLEDVKKATHFAMKLRELADKNNRHPRRGNPNIVLIEEFIRSNGLGQHEANVIRGVCSWCVGYDLAPVLSELTFIANKYA